MLPQVSELTIDTQAKYRELQRFAERRFPPWTVRSTRRTCAEQEQIFQSGPSITGARGCRSWHVLGRAFDITLPGEPRASYAVLGQEWERLGGHWGGRFGNLDDVGHFEWHPGITTEEICPNPADCEAVVAIERELEAQEAARNSRVNEALLAGVVAGLTIWWLNSR